MKYDWFNILNDVIMSMNGICGKKSENCSQKIAVKNSQSYDVMNILLVRIC